MMSSYLSEIKTKLCEFGIKFENRKAPLFKGGLGGYLFILLDCYIEHLSKFRFAFKESAPFRGELIRSVIRFLMSNSR